jgi:hypothetical protein
MVSLYILGFGTLISGFICVPDWPFWNTKQPTWTTNTKNDVSSTSSVSPTKQQKRGKKN